MTLSSSELKPEEYVVDCKDSACGVEISMGFIDFAQLMDAAAFGLQCPKCHKKWVYIKSSVHTGRGCDE